MENLRQEIVKIIGSNPYTTYNEIYDTFEFTEREEIDKVINRLILTDVVTEHDDRLIINY